MKAVTFDRHGGVEVLQYRDDLPIPTIASHEVLVRIKAAAMSYNDLWARQGLPGMDFIFPHISGTDGAGVVEEVGSAVRHMRPGDEVMVHGAFSCGQCPECVRGDPMFCPSFAIWGFQTGPNDGSEAEYGKAKSIAVAGSDAKCEFAASLGADYVVNRNRQRINREVMKITQRRGVDIVFEHTGADTWENSTLCLKWGGTIVTCGATTGFKAPMDIRFLWNQQQNYLGSHYGATAELVDALRFVRSGQIKPLIHRVLPRAEIACGHKLLEEGDVQGKIVLVPE